MTGSSRLKIAWTAIFSEERDHERSEAIPGASRLRNHNEILIEKSDEFLGFVNLLTHTGSSLPP